MRRLLALLLLILPIACATGVGPGAVERSDDGFTITGRVVYVAVEGGFFGLVADDGRRFDVGPLPEEFRVDGLAVRARLQKTPPSIGIHMWGSKAKLLEIERR